MSVQEVPSRAKRQFIQSSGYKPMRLVLGRADPIQTRVSQGAEISEIALTVAKRPRRIGDCLRKRVIGLELESARESATEFELQGIVVGHRVVAQHAYERSIGIRDKEVCGNTQRGILAVRAIGVREREGSCHRRDIIVDEIADKGGAAVTASGRHGRSSGYQAKEFIQDGKRDTPCAAWSEARASAGREVFLRVAELLQEVILEDVDFVVIKRSPNPDRMVTDITRFDCHVVSNLSLVANRPLLHVRNFKVGIKGKQTVVGTDKHVLTIRDWHDKR